MKEKTVSEAKIKGVPSMARKKPVKIEFIPCEVEYIPEILKWATDSRPIYTTQLKDCIQIEICTLEGTLKAFTGGRCVIIKGVEGEIYPCEISIFEKTYEILS